MATPQESARKARTMAANTGFSKMGSVKIVKAGNAELSPAEERRAVEAMQVRRMNDRERTASRAEFIARREDPRNKAARAAAASQESAQEFQRWVAAANKKKGN